MREAREWPGDTSSSRKRPAELASRKDFRDDPSWIARVLEPSITTAQTARALETLLSLGLLVRTRGRLRPAERHVATRPASLAHQLADYHHAMLRTRV